MFIWRNKQRTVWIIWISSSIRIQDPGLDSWLNPRRWWDDHLSGLFQEWAVNEMNCQLLRISASESGKGTRGKRQWNSRKWYLYYQQRYTADSCPGQRIPHGTSLDAVHSVDNPSAPSEDSSKSLLATGSTWQETIKSVFLKMKESASATREKVF